MIGTMLAAGFILGFVASMLAQQFLLPAPVTRNGLLSQGMAILQGIKNSRALLTGGRGDSDSTTFALLEAWTRADVDSGAMTLGDRVCDRDPGGISMTRRGAFQAALKRDISEGKSDEVAQLLAHVTFMAPLSASGGWVDDPVIRGIIEEAKLTLEADYRKQLVPTSLMMRAAEALSRRAPARSYDAR